MIILKEMVAGFAAMNLGNLNSNMIILKDLRKGVSDFFDLHLNSNMIILKAQISL